MAKWKGDVDTLISICDALNALAQVPIHVSASRKFRRNVLRPFRAERTPVDEAQIDIWKTHCLRNGDGEPDSPAPGMYRFDEEGRKAVDLDWAVQLAEEVEVEFEPMNLDDLGRGPKLEIPGDAIDRLDLQGIIFDEAPEGDGNGEE